MRHKKSVADSSLSALTIGSLTLNPTFKGDVTNYTTSTTNATNTITSTAADSTTTVSIMVGGEKVENGNAATWVSGENIVTVTVANETKETVYTVVVTKTE